MNNPQLESIAISYDEGENGLPVYQAHIFMAAPVYQAIKLKDCQTQEAAQKSAEDFLKAWAKIQQYAGGERSRLTINFRKKVKPE